MRPDVKLGIVISLVVVVVAGGYYVYRDARDVPIPVSGEPSDLAGAKTPKTGETKPGSSVEGKRAGGNRSAPGGGASRGSTNRANPAARPTNTAPSRRTANRRGSKSRRNRKNAQIAAANTPKTADGSKAGKPVFTGTKETRTVSTTQGLGAVSPGARAVGHSGTPGRKGTTSHRSVREPVGEATRKVNRATRQGTAGVRAPEQHNGSPAGALSASRSERYDGAKSTTAVAVETHRLQPGDTLAGLSMAYYGSAQHVPLLLAANPQITDPGRLRVGAIVKIPPAPHDRRLAAAEPAASRHLPAQPGASSARRYTVKSGDSFYAIAQSQLGSSSRWEELFELNKRLVKGDPKRLQVGQVITLPE